MTRADIEAMRPGCSCQQYGKSGVPHVQTWRCLVCGEPVDPDLPFVCPAYRPDPTGAWCRVCDQPAEAHTFAAQALGAPFPAGVSEDRCHVCGRLLGIGIPALHLGVCEGCAATPRGQA